MKKTIKLSILALLAALIFSMFTSHAYAQEAVFYGINQYDKVYINDKGLLALSVGDIVRIDKDVDGHYYVSVGDNVFLIPKSKIELITDQVFTEEQVVNNFKRQRDLNLLIGFAYSQLGKPYVWGGRGMSAYDCSSLMQISYSTIEVSIPRTSRSQALFGKQVASNDLKIGDLVFFKGSTGYISHVGMYIGEGDFIHAASSRGRVLISNLSESYYRRHIVGARRILE